MLLPGMIEDERPEQDGTETTPETEPELTTSQMLDALRTNQGGMPSERETEEVLTDFQKQQADATFELQLQQQFQLQKDELKDRHPHATSDQINRILQAKWAGDDVAHEKALQDAWQTARDVEEKNEKQETLEISGGNSSENRTVTRGGSLNRILSILDAN